MTYIITVKNEDTGQEVWRRYDWKIDSDLEAKGEAIEDMMDTLEPWDTYPDTLQVSPGEPI